MRVIYLDNGATMPVYKEVVREMNRIMLEEYGNPSSPHQMGEKALNEIIKAKTALAREINSKPEEIIFTSGATEANNLALLGIVCANKNKKKNKIIISSFEHSSVYGICMELERQGYVIIEIPVSKDGLLNIKRLEEEIDESVLLVSIIHGHNELGVIQNIELIGKMCKQKNVFFHTDCAQSFGKVKVNVGWGIDLLSASAHKIGGPKGMGFLYVKEEVKIKPLMYGGSQERGIRPGTENLPSIVGFAKALQIINKERKRRKVRAVRDYFMQELERIGGKINGSKKDRLYNNVHVSFPADAEQLIIALSEKGIMCSARSACLTKQRKENRVLGAIGLSKREIKGSMRFALNESITKEDIKHVIKVIESFVKSYGN